MWSPWDLLGLLREVILYSEELEFRRFRNTWKSAFPFPGNTARRRTRGPVSRGDAMEPAFTLLPGPRRRNVVRWGAQTPGCACARPRTLPAAETRGRAQGEGERRRWAEERPPRTWGAGGGR